MNFIAFLAADDVTQTPSKFWPEGYEMLFGIPRILIVFFLLWKFAGPTVKKGMAGRTAKIQGELDAGEAAQGAADAEAAQIRQAKGDIDAERARMLAEADAQAAALLDDGRARLEPRSPNSMPSRRRHRCRRRPFRRRTARRDRPPVRRGGRARRHRIARRRNASGADRGASSPKVGASAGSQGMSDSRIEGYARGLFEIARAEGTLDEVEDELFRFARSYESSESCATRSPTSRSRPTQAPGDRRGSARRQGDATTTQLISMVVGSGRARDLPAIIDKLVARASSAKNLEVAEVRTAVAADARPGDAPGGRARQRHRQASQPEGRSSTRPCWAASSPPSATPSSTAPSAPASSN